jgi:hypothetical protein
MAKLADRTTIMLQHLPSSYTRARLLELLDSQGFQGSYDFVYLPVDFEKWSVFGYAFVNMSSHDEALRAWKHFSGFTDWTAHHTATEHPGSDADVRICEVSWGNPIQGLAASIERYRNSPVMHKLVPGHFKPVICSYGIEVEFPPPTKRLRPPRLKHCRPADRSGSSPVHSQEPEM